MSWRLTEHILLQLKERDISKELITDKIIKYLKEVK
jgi:hypothetical protein